MEGGGVPPERAFWKGAKYAYDKVAPNVLGDGYVKIVDTPTFDAYLRKSDKSILLASRGTNITSWGDLKADAQLVANRLRKTHRYFRDVEVLRKIIAQYPPEAGYEYYIAGHSLSVAIANQLMRDFPFIRYAVGYNGAFQPADIAQQNPNIKRLYTDKDFLYNLGGKMFRGVKVIPMDEKKARGFFGRIQSVLTPSGVKGHSLDNFRKLYGLGMKGKGKVRAVIEDVMEKKGKGVILSGETNERIPYTKYSKFVKGEKQSAPFLIDDHLDDKVGDSEATYRQVIQSIAGIEVAITEGLLAGDITKGLKRTALPYRIGELYRKGDIPEEYKPVDVEPEYPLFLQYQIADLASREGIDPMAIVEKIENERRGVVDEDDIITTEEVQTQFGKEESKKHENLLKNGYGWDRAEYMKKRANEIARDLIKNHPDKKEQIIKEAKTRGGKIFRSAMKHNSRKSTIDNAMNKMRIKIMETLNLKGGSKKSGYIASLITGKNKPMELSKFIHQSDAFKKYTLPQLLQQGIIKMETKLSKEIADKFFTKTGRLRKDTDLGRLIGQFQENIRDKFLTDRGFTSKLAMEETPNRLRHAIALLYIFETRAPQLLSVEKSDYKKSDLTPAEKTKVVKYLNTFGRRYSEEGTKLRDDLESVFIDLGASSRDATRIISKLESPTFIRPILKDERLWETARQINFKHEHGYGVELPIHTPKFGIAPHLAKISSINGDIVNLLNKYLGSTDWEELVKDDIERMGTSSPPPTSGFIRGTAGKEFRVKKKASSSSSSASASASSSSSSKAEKPKKLRKGASPQNRYIIESRERGNPDAPSFSEFMSRQLALPRGERTRLEHILNMITKGEFRLEDTPEDRRLYDEYFFKNGNPRQVRNPTTEAPQRTITLEETRGKQIRESRKRMKMLTGHKPSKITATSGSKARFEPLTPALRNAILLIPYSLPLLKELEKRYVDGVKVWITPKEKRLVVETRQGWRIERGDDDDARVRKV